MNFNQFCHPMTIASWFVTQEVVGLQKYFSDSTDSVDSTEFI